MGNCNTSPTRDDNIYATDSHHFVTSQDDTWIQGEWNSTNKGVSCCSGGAPFTYNGVWEIAVDGDEIILNEVYASSCSYLAVPHPCFKQGCMQHRMQKVAQNEWRGTLACKPISLTVLSDQRMSHVTTDGRCILTRNTSTVTKHDPHATEKCHVAHDFTKKSALLPSCYSHNTVMIAQIQTTAPGTEGVFLTDMPAALEGKIAPEQWECAMQEAAAAEAEVRDLLCGPSAICCLGVTCLFYLICIAQAIREKQLEVGHRVAAAFWGSPLRAEYTPGDKRSRSKIAFYEAA